MGMVMDFRAPRPSRVDPCSSARSAYCHRRCSHRRGSMREKTRRSTRISGFSFSLVRLGRLHGLRLVTLLCIPIISAEMIISHDAISAISRFLASLTKRNVPSIFMHLCRDNTKVFAIMSEDLLKRGKLFGNWSAIISKSNVILIRSIRMKLQFHARL